jgi:hypothetical protein
MRLSTILKISLLLLALLAPCGAHALAQEKPRSPGKKAGGVNGDAQSGGVQNGGQRESQLQLRQRARDLAAATADEALKWDDRQAAVRVLAQAADLLWADDPERARAWLTRAWEMTAAVTEESADSEATRRYRSNSPQAGARATVLAVAQKRDGKLADRLLEQLADEKEKSRHESRRGIFDDRSARSEQLLNMALATLERDPSMAAGLAERSLVDGVSFQLQSFLLLLRSRDVTAANRVFDAALNRLATGFANPSEGQVIASYLFTPGRVFGAGSDNTTALAVGTQAPVSERTPAEIDPARARRFLGVMQRILLSLPAPSATANPSQSAQEFVTLAGSLANGFKLYAPELWQPIEQRVAQMMPDLQPASADRRTPSSVREKLKAAGAAGADEKEINRLYVEGLEEAAEKETDPIARKLAYVRAALATTPESVERGRGLASKIDEAELREQVVSFLVYRAALWSLERGRLDEAVKLAADARPIQRAIVLIAAAARLTAENSSEDEEQVISRRFRALDLLSEAEKLLGRDDLPSAALRVRLALVAALAVLDAPRALEVLRSVIASINRTDSFDPADTSAPRIANLDDSSAPSSLPRIRNGFGIKDALTPLARADFEGTVMTAGKLTAPAVRGACMLEIARSILSAQPDKQPKIGVATPVKAPGN